MNTLAEDEKQLVLDIIHTNTFYKEELEAVTSADALKLLNFYTNYRKDFFFFVLELNRKDIITPGTELYRLKQEYDENPTIQLRRKK